MLWSLSVVESAIALVVSPSPNHQCYSFGHPKPFYLYMFVERYLKALSARITMMFLPLASGRFAIWVAVQRAAPAD